MNIFKEFGVGVLVLLIELMGDKFMCVCWVGVREYYKIVVLKVNF